jgi:hypothetical protein
MKDVANGEKMKGEKMKNKFRAFALDHYKQIK